MPVIVTMRGAGSPRHPFVIMVAPETSPYDANVSRPHPVRRDS
jgi:hypothetical protein